MTLLEKALATRTRRRHRTDVTPEEMELVIAWLQGQISYGQVRTAFGVNSSSNVYSRVSIILKVAFQRGRLQIARQRPSNR
jgi:hypothetical protein